MKLCKDCKHYRPADDDEYKGFSMCVSPSAHAEIASYLANGMGTYADTMRTYGPCGMSGRWHEPFEQDPPPPPRTKLWWEFWK